MIPEIEVERVEPTLTETQAPAEPLGEHFRTHGKRLEALGKAMQDINSTIAQLAELAHDCGLSLRYSIGNGIDRKNK